MGHTQTTEVSTQKVKTKKQSIQQQPIEVIHLSSPTAGKMTAISAQTKSSIIDIDDYEVGESSSQTTTKVKQKRITKQPARIEKRRTTRSSKKQSDEQSDNGIDDEVD